MEEWIMECKMKLGEVLNLNQTLKSIIDDNNTKTDTLFKFKLLGIMKSLENHVVNFETIRNEKIMKLGKETEDGSVQIPKEDSKTIKKFNDSIMQVVNCEVTVNIDKLKASDVFNKGVNAEHLVGLYPIIEE